MNTMARVTTEPPGADVSADRETLYRDGIVALNIPPGYARRADRPAAEVNLLSSD
jgi:hypothetical protein